MFVALLFSVCSWKWKRICRLISPFCVHWLKIMLSLARCSLSRKVLPTWRADSPESFRTLGEQLKKINLNVLCEAMSTNRSIQGDIVLCALAFKQYGEEQRGKEEWWWKMNEGIKVGSKVIQDVHSSLFVLKLTKLWKRDEKRWKMQHVCWWHFCLICWVPCKSTQENM